MAGVSGKPGGKPQWICQRRGVSGGFGLKFIVFNENLHGKYKISMKGVKLWMNGFICFQSH